jgi:hypothetical protein
VTLPRFLRDSGAVHSNHPDIFIKTTISVISTWVDYSNTKVQSSSPFRCQNIRLLTRRHLIIASPLDGPPDIFQRSHCQNSTLESSLAAKNTHYGRRKTWLREGGDSSSRGFRWSTSDAYGGQEGTVGIDTLNGVIRGGDGTGRQIMHVKIFIVSSLALSTSQRS